jgi:hypothetical protein
MDKDVAVKILQTNIYRQLCKKWVLFQVPYWVIVIVLEALSDFAILPTLNFGITLPSSTVKVENVMPAIFTGALTTSGIIVGFLAVSAHNFRNWLEDRVSEYIDMSADLEILHQKAVESKVESTIEKSKDTKELCRLNRNAYAHLEEHLVRFMSTYLIVAFLLLLSEIPAFISILASSAFVYYFVIWTVLCLSAIFSGLIVFMWQFASWNVHEEIAK